MRAERTLSGLYRPDGPEITTLDKLFLPQIYLWQEYGAPDRGGRSRPARPAGGERHGYAILKNVSTVGGDFAWPGHDLRHAAAADGGRLGRRDGGADSRG